MDALGKLIDLTTAVIVMLILPIMWARGMNERLIMKYAGCLSEAFVEDVCHHGGISQERYETFLNGLSAAAYGLIVDIETHSPVAEPVYENGVFTGRVVDTERICCKEEILEHMYDSGNCAFIPGTAIYVTVGHDENKISAGGMIVSNPGETY